MYRELHDEAADIPFSINSPFFIHTVGETMNICVAFPSLENKETFLHVSYEKPKSRTIPYSAISKPLIPAFQRIVSQI